MKMRKTITKATIGVALVAALVGGSATAASAESAGGGTWYYGVDLANNWSNYHHPIYYHRATAYNDWGSIQRRYANAGYWANASISAAVSGNRAAWYHNYGATNF